MRAVVAVAVLASTFVIVPAAEAALPDVGFSVATSAHGEAAGTVDVTIELSTTGLPLTQALVFDVVDLATGTAGASDYSFTQPVPSLQFDVGDNDGATRTVQVTISQDSIDEPGETVDLELQAVSGGDVDPAAVGHELTISDDDAPPTISIGNATAANEGTNASFAVSLNHPSSQPISVAWTRANGTTTDGDFTGGAFGTVNFAALEVSKTISVPLNNDNVDEPGANETFTVALGAITGSASLGTSIGTGSIIDQTPTPSIAINDAAATEGSPVQFTVTLSRPSQASVTVGWTTNNGTAVAPGDYTADSDTVIFPPLSTSQPISVSTIADGVFEGGSENFTVTLSGPTNATISDSTGLGTINETGGAPSVSISDALNVDEGTSAVFNVTLSGQSANVITVPWTRVNTTTTNADFTGPSSGTVTFGANETAATITIQLAADGVAEPGANETYTIQLGVPTGGATINDGVGSGSIVDTTAQPTISIGTAFAVAEGNTAQFSVSLSTTSTSPITVPWTRTNNTTTNADFTGSGSGTVTFVPGDGHETIMIPISADGMHEPGPNELYSVVLGTPTGPATVAVSSGGGSIVDTTPEPSMSINDRLAINEGTTATFTVTLTGPADETISVPWTRTNGTTVNADFTGSATGTLTFLAGDTSKTISIPLLDDGVNEPGGNETYSVGLGAITGPAAMSRATGNGSIVDVNATPGISINDRLALNEGTNAVFTVTLSNASSSQVEVPWSRINGTTTNGDFTGASVGTVIFAPGDTSETITIGLASDTIDEVGANETYSVVLGEVSGTATITKGTGSGSIVDQTPQPTVSIGTAFAVKEGATANFSVSLSSTSTSVITVPWTRANGTTSNSDFTGVSSGTVTFAAGDGNETILIPINADGLYEPGPNETYTVTLGTPTGPATVPSPVGQGTIDDEDVVPTVSIGPSSATESAGAMTFTVTLSGPSDVAIDVDYTTGPPATATVGTDYTPAFGTVTIPADALSATFDVTILPDLLDEIDETFTVTLSNPVGATLGTASALGTITDDDAPPTLSINSPSAIEGTSLRFDISLSGPSGKSVSVTYSTSAVFPTSAADFGAITSTVVVFAPGEEVKTVFVTTVVDGVDEANETMRLNLTASTNATRPTPPFGVGTIIDGDGDPTVTIADAPRMVEAPGGAQLAFPVILGGAPTDQTVTVDYTTADATAVATQDYTGAATPIKLTFDPGVTTREIVVPITDDVVDEFWNETMLVNLTNALAGTVPITIEDAQATGTIGDNDNVAPVISIQITDGSGTPKTTFSQGELVRLNISFTDPGLADSHHLLVQWGDGTKTDVPITPVGARTTTATHTFGAANAYPISITVTDDEGQGGASGYVSVSGASVGGHATALVDTSQGRWFMYNAAGSLVQNFYFGNPGDYPFMGDWDCDGIETPGLYRQSDGYVYLRNSNTVGPGEIKFFFGNPGDVPIAGDFNGNGCDTVSIYRPSEARFYIINKLGKNDGGLGAAEFSYIFGNLGDKPFVGDFDNDGVETVGLHRESTGLVYFRNAHTQGNADQQFIFGDPGDRLVAGDWNSNGQFTPALYRGSNTTMYFRYSNTQGVADHQWSGGQSSWIPVSGATGF